MSTDLFDFNDEHLARLKAAEAKEAPFRKGKTHRFTLAFESGDAPTLQIECLDMKDPERACSMKDSARNSIPDTCVLQELWLNVGWDAVNIEGGSATLDLNMPVGYDSEGYGENYEDWIVLHLEGPE